jgi:TolB-like protein/DNA-binding winged helix-turn-helix (wHTH) protein/Tfp pilus assembly protein PilF
MEAPATSRQCVRFGAFELDLRSEELRKHGNKVKLQGQPVKILAILLARPGEMVTREELGKELWPGDTFVDFDAGLNSAIKKLREALGDSRESSRFIETLPRRGYRFIAPVEEAESAAPDPGTAPGPVTSDDPAAQALAGRRWSRYWLPVMVGAGVLALIFIGAYGARWRERPGAETRPHPATVQHPIQSLAVLPLENLSGDPDQEYFAEGMTDALTTDLAKIGTLKVISRTSSMQFKGTKKPLQQIAQELNVDALVEGSVQRSGSRVRISARLIDVRSDTNLWAESYERDLRDVLALQSQVARAIASEIKVDLQPQEQARLATVRQVDPEAEIAYLKGRYYWNKRTADGMQKAEHYFQQAIDSDPTYAAAYSGLADCNSGLTWHGFKSPADALPKAYAAARKAVEIDPQSAEAHASLGLVFSHSWNWAGAEAEFRRALELDPQYANAHHWYGDYLSIKSRHDEALAEARRALELDPLNLMIGTWVALRYYQARDYPRAIEQGRNSVELDSNFAAAHLLLGEAYVQAGLRSEGVSELKRAASLSGGSPLYAAQAGVALAAAGRRSEALQIAHELETISKKRYVSPYGLAQIYAALKSDEDTFKWLQAAYRDRAVWMEYLAVDPIFDRYRSDRRFQELLRRIDLP